jgi:hypothetical protein
MPSVTLYPTSDALISNPSYVGVNPTSPTTKYDKVDEAVADDNTTYISSSTPNVCGVDFGMSDLSGWTDDIQKITVFMRVQVITVNKNYWFQPRVNRIAYGAYTVKAGIAAGGNNWQDFTWDYPKNPVTGLSWTVDSVNAMEAGFQWYGTDTKVYGYLTQLNVIVTPMPVTTVMKGLILKGLIIK